MPATAGRPRFAAGAAGLAPAGRSAPVSPAGSTRAELGIGLVGCGRVSTLHLDAASGVRGARLVAATDLVTERAERAAARYGAAICGSVEELVSRDDVDLVVVATPSGTHAELGALAARAGRHVLVEKPMDVDPAAARQLVTVCHERAVTLSVISQHRFDPGTVRLKTAIDELEIDPVVLAEGRVWWYRDEDYYRADSWRGTRALDGGALMNQGIHTLDLLRWLLGPATSISAHATTALHAIEMEDTLTATIRFARGTLATLAVTTAAAPGQAETLSFAGPQGTYRLESGTLVVHPADGPSPTTRADNSHETPEPTAARGSTDLAATAHRAQLQDVVDAIRTARPPAVTGEDGLAAVELVTAAYRSARLGQQVTPSDTPDSPTST